MLSEVTAVTMYHEAVLDGKRKLRIGARVVDL